MRHSVRWSPLLLAIALSLANAGCLSPIKPPETVSTIAPLVGLVGDVPTGRSTTATIGDIANGATVSLIDVTTGATIATTVSAPDGKFRLSFGASVPVTEGRPYYMEAAKGLAIGSSANRAGATLARVRTIVVYQNRSWSSLSGESPTIGRSTTAVAAIADLRHLTEADQLALLNRVSGTSFAETPAISQAEYALVYGLVDGALNQDQDPIEVLSYDPAGATLDERYAKKVGPLVLYDRFAVNGLSGQATASLTPPYNQLTFYGQNLPASASVTLGDRPVATWSVNPQRTQLTVTLAATAHSGWLEILQGASSVMGPFVPVAGTVGPFAGNGSTRLVDGKGPQAGLNSGFGMAVDAAGNVYMPDTRAYVLRKIAPDGAVTTLAGTGVSGYADGPGTSAQFVNPTDATVDASGNVYMVDNGGHRIRKVAPNGTVTTVAGTGVPGFADGPALNAQFQFPRFLTLDAGGTLYVADAGNNRIRKIAPDGTVSTLAGSGTAGFADGASSSAQFSGPNGLAIDAGGNLYVGDWGNSRIRKVAPDGTVSTYAGSSAGYVEGAKASARFASPAAVEFDAAGNLYVADVGNNRIRKITPGGTVSTAAGIGQQGTAFGPTATAQLNLPLGVLPVPNGRLYIADQLTHYLKVLVP